MLWYTISSNETWATINARYDLARIGEPKWQLMMTLKLLSILMSW